ncbi:MAG: glycosyl transferase, partial [Lentimicrobium sp.]|nr:glycosyl transferase [Lentimicrobium sp.]
HDENQEELIDYKFFCFHGEPRILQVTQSKNGKKEVGYFNMEFLPMPFYTGKIKPDYSQFSKPACFEKMVGIAEKLSKDIVHVRIDLYCINDRVYFGEYTFHNAGGIVRFSPPEWNGVLGDMIELTKD